MFQNGLFGFLMGTYNVNSKYKFLKFFLKVYECISFVWI